MILIFPSGTRSDENIAFKRGAATVALHARVPLVRPPLHGQERREVAVLMNRPPIRGDFGVRFRERSFLLGGGGGL